MGKKYYFEEFDTVLLNQSKEFNLFTISKPAMVSIPVFNGKHKHCCWVMIEFVGVVLNNLIL
jgi:hypothetical protein